VVVVVAALAKPSSRCRSHRTHTIPPIFRRWPSL
jgi:hypothetical protein